MNKRSFAIAALAVAGVIFSAGLVMADDLDDDEMMTGAGGGGWWKNMGAKNTFGCYLDPSDMSMSEFVLQARDMGVAVHAYQFDDIVFNYDAGLGTGSAEAWGRAWVDGMDVSFHLMLEDNGHRSLDRLMLEVSGDYVGSWEITGISGGQIWVYLE
jgi:hypothetical protein